MLGCFEGEVGVKMKRSVFGTVSEVLQAALKGGHTRRKEISRLLQTLSRASVDIVEVCLCVFCVCVCVCVCVSSVFCVFVSSVCVCVCLCLLSVCVCVCVCVLLSLLNIVQDYYTFRGSDGYGLLHCMLHWCLDHCNTEC